MALRPFTIRSREIAQPFFLLLGVHCIRTRGTKNAGRRFPSAVFCSPSCVHNHCLVPSTWWFNVLEYLQCVGPRVLWKWVIKSLQPLCKASVVIILLLKLVSPQDVEICKWPAGFRAYVPGHHAKMLCSIACKYSGIFIHGIQIHLVEFTLSPKSQHDNLLREFKEKENLSDMKALTLDTT